MVEKHGTHPSVEFVNSIEMTHGGSTLASLQKLLEEADIVVPAGLVKEQLMEWLGVQSQVHLMSLLPETMFITFAMVSVNSLCSMEPLCVSTKRSAETRAVQSI